ncbi:hypothetical protein [Streptomyces fulvoviolaceus]|uniref:hypothetical protein n=1 Tax=Streptomyces fulvoviolaceus TaxID=285535 RepID=UPI0021BFB2AB|nr:hypothetical protein [Streptomyces fulvoviolaceus]MCT9084760.1 hypothetical protein [Streptomyces fulvoviolaceus]
MSGRTRSGNGSSQDTAAAPRRQFPYGIDDPAWAAEHGFGDADGTQQEQPSPQPGKRAAAQQQRLVDALFGPGRRELSTRTATGLVGRANSDGCLAEAQRVLYGDQARWFRTEVAVAVNNLEAAAHHRVTRDPAYRAVLARWARCVAPVRKAEDPAQLRSCAARGRAAPAISISGRPRICRSGTPWPRRGACGARASRTPAPSWSSSTRPACVPSTPT